MPFERSPLPPLLDRHLLWMVLNRFSIPKLPIISGEAGGEETWISDDSCDDVNNNQFCEYDGGDCCGSNVIKQYCIDCECLSKYKTVNLLILSSTTSDDSVLRRGLISH